MYTNVLTMKCGLLCLPNLLPDGVTSARVNTAQQRIGQKKSNI